MTKPDPHLAHLQEIRTLMERSSRFLSLSGLSGVIAGMAALAGAAAGYIYLGRRPFAAAPLLELPASGYVTGLSPIPFFLTTALLVLLVALSAGLWPTILRARRQGYAIWSATSRRLATNLALPLVVGGLFVLALYRQGMLTWIAPATLVFYGLALLHADKYTKGDIRYLGMGEIALGLLGCYFPGYGLECWTLGFGVLHIAYGIWMWNRFERAEMQNRPE